MTNIDIVKEFEQLEKDIEIFQAQNKDITGLLKQKTRLLQVCYSQMDEAMKAGKLQEIAPVFAKEIAFLNNIKNIQAEINEDTSETEAEIAKVHANMRAKGLGWILDNLPKKAE